MTAVGALLGNPTGCKTWPGTPEVSVHWYPDTGPRCYCGQHRRPGVYRTTLAKKSGLPPSQSRGERSIVEQVGPPGSTTKEPNMNGTELTNLVRDFLEAAFIDPAELPELNEVGTVRTFESAGVMTRDDGLVVQLTDGTEFQVRVVMSRRGSSQRAD